MEFAKKDLQIEYDVDLKHLMTLNDSTLKLWETKHKQNKSLIGGSAIHPLDTVYQIIKLQ